jgi:hypothetical protein
MLITCGLGGLTLLVSSPLLQEVLQHGLPLAVKHVGVLGFYQLDDVDPPGAGRVDPQLHLAAQGQLAGDPHVGEGGLVHHLVHLHVDAVVVVAADQKFELALSPQAWLPDQQGLQVVLGTSRRWHGQVSKSATGLTSQLLGGNLDISEPGMVIFIVSSLCYT